MDCNIIMKLLSPILSKPVKIDRDTVNSAPEKMLMEVMDTSNVDSGLRRTVEAMKLAINKETRDKVNPVTISKVSPATIMPRAFSSLLEAWNWAMYFVIAESTPKSRNRANISDGINAIEYSPNSSGDRSLAKITVPAAVIRVEATNPKDSFKPPVAEVFAIPKALSIFFTTLGIEEIQKGIRAGGNILGGPLRPRFRAKPPGWWNEKYFGYYVVVDNSETREIWGANMVFRKEVSVDSFLQYLITSKI